VEAARIPWRPLGHLLVERGFLSEDELARALTRQATTGKRLGEIIVELGFISRPALSRVLAAQYGVELKSETGFGTGLRAQIERRHDDERGRETTPAEQPFAVSADAAPSLLEAVPEPEPEAAAGPTAEDVLFAQLEDQWANLAAAERLLADRDRELAALRFEAERRHAQAVRIARRARERGGPFAGPTVEEPAEPAVDAHLVFVQLPERYALAERDGPPPGQNDELELPDVSARKLLVERIGNSPFPRDPRRCAFAHEVHPHRPGEAPAPAR
jgi:hypothetical protein